MAKFIKLHMRGKLCIIDKESICAIAPNVMGTGSCIYFKNIPGIVEDGRYGGHTIIYVDESTEKIWSMLD